MLLLDFEKAFDSVWHEVLLHKLLARGCYISLAYFLFSERTLFSISVGKAQSSSCNVSYGVLTSQEKIELFLNV
jgi:hypothetical protein